MLEKLFGRKSPENNEQRVEKMIAKEFEFGVNGPAIHSAILQAERMNEAEKLGLTPHHIFNMVEKTAKLMSTSMDHALYDGSDNTFANIENEMQIIRQKHWDSLEENQEQE